MDAPNSTAASSQQRQGAAVAQIVSGHISQLIADGDEDIARRMYGDEIVDAMLHEAGSER
jgi:hypothetical protein